MARRELTEINAGSMADIAFLLLIFFLVTTTMSTNTGMQRKLPPMDKDKIENPPPVKERNVMVVLVNKDNVIAIKGRPIPLNQITEKAKIFFSNPQHLDNLPEVKYKEIPFFGNYPVSKGLVSLQTDRNTSYEKYLQVQNELVRAISELRDEKSREKFGVGFDDLTDEQRDAVSKAIPLAISEAEPRRMTQAK